MTAKKLIWITGAHGFIGRHLAKWLSLQGHAVIGLGHGPWPHSEAMQWGVHRWLNGGIHSGNLQQLLRDDGAPDCIFHLAGGSSVGAAIASPHEDFARTVVTTAELLDWIRREAPNSRLVAVSSAAVYGAGHTTPLREDGAYLPFSPYGHHKLMMEQLCRSYVASYDLRAVVVRLFSVYGNWLKKQLLWDICNSLSSGVGELRLGGTGDELRDWTDIRDVVRVLELAMNFSFDSGSMPVINGGSGEGTSVAQIAAMVLASWPEQAIAAFTGKSRPGDPFALVADGSRLQAAGFEWRIPVHQGIREYVEWYRQYSGR
jgi:UDP-glucose 4-epimerase